MKKYNMLDFFEQLLIPDLQKMVDQQLHYYAFAVICEGIELLGAGFDDDPLGENGKSEGRFTNGLANFFKARYRQEQALFFKVLRGPLIHQLRPGKEFVLASEAKDKIKRESHLTEQKDGSTILIVEVFLDDFIKAYKAFKNRLERDNLQSRQRFTEVFLVVADVDVSVGKQEWNPETKSLFTHTPTATGSFVPPSKFPESAAD
jgi:hypothetical protein